MWQHVYYSVPSHVSVPVHVSVQAHECWCCMIAMANEDLASNVCPNDKVKSDGMKSRARCCVVQHRKAGSQLSNGIWSVCGQTSLLQCACRYSQKNYTLLEWFHEPVCVLLDSDGGVQLVLIVAMRGRFVLLVVMSAVAVSWGIVGGRRRQGGAMRRRRHNGRDGYSITRARRWWEGLVLPQSHSSGYLLLGQKVCYRKR